MSDVPTVRDVVERLRSLPPEVAEAGGFCVPDPDLPDGAEAGPFTVDDPGYPHDGEPF